MCGTSYLGTAGGADEVELVAHEDGDRGHLQTDRALQLLLFDLNLVVNVVEQLEIWSLGRETAEE